MTKQEKSADNSQKTEDPKDEKQGKSNLSDEIAKLKEELSQMKDQAIRAIAESENIRKRSEKEIEEARKFALSSFAKDLIDVVENLYRSTSHITKESRQNEDIEKIYAGISMTQDEFMKILKKYGLERIAPQVGDEFDHNYHQAISTLKNEKHPDNAILDVIQAGYILKGRLIRPALVVVSSA